MRLRHVVFDLSAARLVVKLATWNVNSIKQREAALAQWLRQAQPDVVCLQELKCQTEAFPRATFEDLGYHCAVHGQKGFNGVAILSKLPAEDVTTALPGNGEDGQSRYIEAVISLPRRGALRVVGIYAPNGNPAPGAKFNYKLEWFARLKDHAKRLRALEEPLIIAGDFNIIPRASDVYSPANWTEDALFRLEARRAFRTIAHLGFTDAIMACDSSAGQYTFWDYQAGAWQKNLGLRIDHILLSPEAAGRLESAGIDRAPRSWDKPSDHVPVWASLAM